MGANIIGDSKVKVKEFQLVLGDNVKSEQVPEM